MRFTTSTSVLLLASILTLSLSHLPITTHASPVISELQPRGGCSGGVNVCCGSSSVGCSGGVCRACCGSTCGCFYERGSKCSSNFPCTDVTKPDFAMTNGQCVKPRGGSSGSGSGGSNGSSSGSGSKGGSSSSSGSSSTGSSFCSQVPPVFARLFGC